MMIATNDRVMRDGLSYRIDWHAYGFELVGTYDNGQTALQALADIVPDLIISDVGMPVMDGLELAEQVQRHCPNAKMALLTSFDEFDYARRASKYHIHDFIFKPVMMPDIRSLLSRIRQQLDERTLLITDHKAVDCNGSAHLTSKVTHD
ncbi:response regulator [Paenibacillus campi]|uniref:response regulator n=1 Tax=Paenibacillus campi TaxID=3106031 RepID=UPI002AFF2115|nr:MULTISPECIES: response regulator [unclassified Paenibacillus]